MNLASSRWWPADILIMVTPGPIIARQGLDFGWDATDKSSHAQEVWQTTVNLQGWGGITNSQGIFTVLPC